VSIKFEAGTLTRSLSSEQPWILILRASVLACLFVLIFSPVIQGLVVDWWTHSEYSHGFLLPLLSGFLIWRRRKELQDCTKKTSLVGFGVFVMGLGIYLIGWAGQEEFVQRLALPVTLGGLIYFLFGKEIFRLCSFPVGYLFLMIPIPYTVYKDIALKLRLFDAEIAASWSSFLGVPVFQEGYLLHLPKITLEVADACSGVLSIMALLSLGILYVHLLKMPVWKKTILWTVLIPVSILANVIRIGTVVVLVHYSGQWILYTTFHRLNGTFNFLLGFMAIVLIAFVVKRIPSSRENWT
jgi:exosortase